MSEINQATARRPLQDPGRPTPARQQLDETDDLASATRYLAFMDRPTERAAVEQLRRALAAVGELVGGVQSDQWLAPTPCDDWSVGDVVSHLIGMNLVFTALLNDQSPPERGGDHLGHDPAGSYARSAAGLLEAFDQPGALERTYRSTLGAATGADRLQMRLYDLLAHGWDLAKATGQAGHLPEDLAAQALTFARGQISPESRPGRFAPAQDASEDAPAIDQLVAFLGRPLD